MFSSFLNWKYLKNWLQGSFYRLFLSYTELCQNDLKVTFQRRALLDLLINRNSHFSRTDLWNCKVNQGLIIISNNRVNNFPHINTYITQKVTLKFFFYSLFSLIFLVFTLVLFRIVQSDSFSILIIHHRNMERLMVFGRSTSGRLS